MNSLGIVSFRCMSRERVLERLAALSEISSGKVAVAKKKKTIKTRKDLHKSIEVNRASVIALKKQLSEAEALLKSQTENVERLRKMLDDVKSYLLRDSNNLQTMDLSGADALRERRMGDNSFATFYIGGKEVGVKRDDSNGAIDTIPLTDYLASFEKPVEEPKEEANDAEDFSDANFVQDLFSTYERL